MSTVALQRAVEVDVAEWIGQALGRHPARGRAAVEGYQRQVVAQGRHGSGAGGLGAHDGEVRLPCILCHGDAGERQQVGDVTADRRVALDHTGPEIGQYTARSQGTSSRSIA
jgi:hypothetical protein